MRPRTDRLQLKVDRYTTDVGPGFFQCRYLAYQVFDISRSIATVVYGALHQIGSTQPLAFFTVILLILGKVEWRLQ
jgi:hypothetical protein